MQDNYQSQLSTLTGKNKSLEKELRGVREELELERRGRSANSGSLEKKLVELQDTESRLLVEIENLKKDKEKKFEEMTELLASEKEVSRNKISELEKRTKDAELQRGSIYMDHEKERAKWNMERDNLIENLERVEKRKETCCARTRNSRWSEAKPQRSRSFRETATRRYYTAV